MNKVRSALIITVVIALLLGSFVVAAGAAKSIAGTAPKQTLGTAALDLPSPFLLAASAPIISVVDANSSANALAYACSLVAQRPADWTTYKKRTTFNAYWTLKNTGTKVWGIHGVDVAYRGGTAMHTSRGFYDLPAQVGPGQKITLAADMIAPKQPGYYVSNWGLYVGSQVFCKFYLVIYVSG
jgi:hypothetical protein